MVPRLNDQYGWIDRRNALKRFKIHAGKNACATFIPTQWVARGTGILACVVLKLSQLFSREGVCMASTKKQVPQFRSEDEERSFWAEHDSTEFIDWQAAERRRFPHLKPSLRTIPCVCP
jgi:CopG antitoxin of type II toxin-antitoxin system